MIFFVLTRTILDAAIKFAAAGRQQHQSHQGRRKNQTAALEDVTQSSEPLQFAVRIKNPPGQTARRASSPRSKNLLALNGRQEFDDILDLSVG
ncbi:MAG: hypothetical protein RL618_1913 [Pseudomonadota bacterium]